MARENTSFQINGYSYADAKLEFNGIELPEITAFDFSKTQVKTNNYGLGGNPTSRTRGIKEFTGTMDIGYDTAKLLRALSTDGTLTGVPVGVMIIKLEKEDGSNELCTLSFFEFSGDGTSGSQGDENLIKSIDVIFGNMTFTTI